MSITLTPDRPPVEDPPASPPAAATPPGARRPALTDQEEFDAAIRRNSRLAMRILGGVAVLAALVMSAIALIVSVGASDTGSPTTPVSASTSTPSTAPIAVSVAESNKGGPDGKMHDSFSQTDFAVKVGQPTRLRINNTDGGPHSITSAATGVSITVLPGVHTYTLVATKAGRFEWVCVIPCDSAAHGWAMTHPGYMAGYITAT